MMMRGENNDLLLGNSEKIEPQGKVPISKRNQLRTFVGNLIKRQQQQQYL